MDNISDDDLIAVLAQLGWSTYNNGMVLRTDNTEVQLDDIRAICNRVFTFAWEAGFASGVNSGVKPEHLDKTKCAN